jgi:broad specificity phosphatase PhoE
MLVLIRHVHSLLNAHETDFHDCDISKKGQEQLAGITLSLKSLLGDQWQDLPFRGFVSPFLRTLHTAMPLHKIGINFTVDHRIAETPDAAYKRLKLTDVISRHKEFPDYDWRSFPKSGVSQDARTMKQYYEDMGSFIKELPKYSIVVTHLSPILDLVAKMSTKTDKIIGNASVTVIKDGKLLFCAQT